MHSEHHLLWIQQKKIQNHGPQTKRITSAFLSLIRNSNSIISDGPNSTRRTFVSNINTQQLPRHFTMALLLQKLSPGVLRRWHRPSASAFNFWLGQQTYIKKLTEGHYGFLIMSPIFTSGNRSPCSTSQHHSTNS